MMTVIIGLTGSIGTGKSTISKMIAQLQIPVIDADKIAREVVEPGAIAHEKIAAAFGETVFYQDQTLNRQALGEIVFSDEKKRVKLNSIIHPEIRKEMLNQRDAYVHDNVPCIVMDIPLLFESKLTHFIDKVMVVAVDEHVQLERIIERDHSSEAEAKQKINAQIAIDKKTSMAHAVIDNNGTVEASYQQLKTILDRWDIPLKGQEHNQ